MDLDRNKIRKLQNRFSGKRVFLLGNGPSVRFSDLEKLKNEVTFAANRFHLCYEKTSFRPTLTFLEDKKMIENHLSEISESCETPLLVPGRLFPKKDCHSIAVRYLFLIQEKANSITRFSDDLESGVYLGSSVMFTMLQVALYTGASEVILYGVDHSFQVPRKKADVGENYVVDGGEKNHFIPHYRKPEEVWCPPRTQEIEEAFSLSKKEYEKRGVPLWNATRGGELEIFPRKNFDDFFGFFQGAFSYQSQRRRILIRLGDHLQDFEKAFCVFLKKQGHQVTLSTKEDQNLEDYEVIFSTGNPAEKIPDHPFSYYFMSRSFRDTAALSGKHKGPLVFENRDFLKAFDYYDGIFVLNEKVREELCQFHVRRPIYPLCL